MTTSAAANTLILSIRWQTKVANGMTLRQKFKDTYNTCTYMYTTCTSNGYKYLSKQTSKHNNRGDECYRIIKVMQESWGKKVEEKKINRN